MVATPAKTAYAVILMIMVLACAGMLGYVTYITQRTWKVSGIPDDGGFGGTQRLGGAAGAGAGAGTHKRGPAPKRAVSHSPKPVLGGGTGAAASALPKLSSPQELAALRDAPALTVGVAVSPSCPHCVTMSTTLTAMHTAGQLAGGPQVVLVTKEALAGSGVQVEAVPQMLVLGRGKVEKGPLGAMNAQAIGAYLTKVASG